MKNDVWYITGVTSGIGLGLATVLLESGYKVAGTSRDMNKLIKIKTLIENPNFLPLQVDITNVNNVNDSIEKTINCFGTLTTIVNNSGMGKIGAIEEVSNEDYKELFNCMYFGPLNVIKAALPYFRKMKYGYIFNIGSVGGIKPVPYIGAYGSAKFALCGLSESLHYEVKKFNIKVSYVVLGAFATSITTDPNRFSKAIDGYNTLEELKKSFIKKYPGKSPFKLAEVLIRYGNQDEIPFNIMVGEAGLMKEVICNKINDLECQYNTQIESNLNTDL
ncbi:hypothetical protein DICPUDRAFT_150000 [Dictyostelium purpureum]|uniref:Short-chain dehydrogenase/reductase SDR n=1 Tax=Dictyostelium purpureum TaxID=5786 RepID=F0ZF73_DICPU|nr:uncharacterized protein DICPUDRAFT_150000 [Dictyostelium purpureum]EGC37426.1 hypothetical protein DICPUDRAFT_150000 [Dictyostelium purpureum]|eukprot:XP_003286079.1 hypothetical protein DICPUDRAFT_150000 [Dictyostelium purpureum]